MRGGRFVALVLLALGVMAAELLAAGPHADAPDAAEASAECDAQPTELLKRAAKLLADQSGFSVAMQEQMALSMGKDEARREMRIQMFRLTLRMARPNFLTAQVRAFGAKEMLVSDGQTMYQVDRGAKEYSRQTAPASLKEILSCMFSDDDSDLNRPHLRLVESLLSDDPFEIWMREVNRVDGLADEQIDGVDCHVLRLVGEQCDQMVWIDRGDQPLVRKMTLDYTKTAIRDNPQNAAKFKDVKFTAGLELQLTDWKLGGERNAEAFAFRPDDDWHLAKSGDANQAKDKAGKPAESPQKLTPGVAMPAVELELVGGGKLNLSDHQHKKIVVLDLSTTYIDTAAERIGQLQDVAKRFEKRGVVCYAATLFDQPEDVQKFVAKHQLAVPVALANKEFLVSFDGFKLPSTLIIDEDGILQAVQAKYFSLDAGSPTRGLAETLTADLEALLSGRNLAAEYLSKRAQKRDDETTAK